MTQLHLRTWGDGDRVAVLIHGLSSHSETWNAVGKALAEHGYRVIAPDLRGHGRSPRGSYSVGEWVADLLDGVAPEPDLAIGHSLGATVLLEAAARLRPGRAVYEDPPWPIGGNPEQLIAEFESRKHLSRDAIWSANPRWTEAEVDARYDGFARWDERAARSFLAGRRDHTPSGPPLQPSLVMLAEKNPFMPQTTAERLRRIGWEVRTIPGTGHQVHLDDRRAYLRCILGWSAGRCG